MRVWLALVALVACAGQGPQGPAGQDGEDGRDGVPGAPGAQGPAGPAASASVSAAPAYAKKNVFVRRVVVPGVQASTPSAYEAVARCESNEDVLLSGTCTSDRNYATLMESVAVDADTVEAVSGWSCKWMSQTARTMTAHAYCLRTR